MTIATIDLVGGDNLPFVQLQIIDQQTTLPIDLSAVGTSVSMQFFALGQVAARGTPMFTVACTFVTNGSDGKIQFNFPGTVLNVVAGQYEGQIVVTFPTGRQTLYDTLKFKVR